MVAVSVSALSVSSISKQSEMLHVPSIRQLQLLLLYLHFSLIFSRDSSKIPRREWLSITHQTILPRIQKTTQSAKLFRRRTTNYTVLERFFGERCEGSQCLQLHLVKRKLCRKDAPVMVIWDPRLMFFVPVANKVLIIMTLSPLVVCCYTNYWIIHPTATCTLMYCTVTLSQILFHGMRYKGFSKIFKCFKGDSSS